MKRRQFLQTLALLGLVPPSYQGFAQDNFFYTLPELAQARLLHFSDCHAQLLPVYYREPSFTVKESHSNTSNSQLTAHAWLSFLGIKLGSAQAYAFSEIDFNAAAQQYGKMGGFAHLATLIKQLRAQSGAENTLLLDGGDSWQGSATALWTQGQDMVSACNLLGVDVMTGHWEFTYGQAQVLQNIADFKGEFVAQNIKLTEEAQFAADTEIAIVFKPYIIKRLKQARVAIIGQAFPFTPIAHPHDFVPNWQFGIQESALQAVIDEIQAEKTADVIVLLSHNGLAVDLKLASRISGLDIILGGHTHDALPKPLLVANSAGKTWVSNAGSHGKFLAVLDLEIKNRRLVDLRYQLVPVFANFLRADEPMQRLIEDIRAPFIETLRQPLTIAEELLYRRDTFCGSFDRILLNALRQINDTELAFSPGFRWGSCVLKGETVFFEDLMNHSAITYPNCYVSELSGLEIKAILEDVADNLFNPDPYYQQGGDMVRVGGMTYRCDKQAKIGNRISECRLSNGALLDASKKYRVSGWASMNAQASGKPIWDVAAQYLQDH